MKWPTLEFGSGRISVVAEISSSHVSDEGRAHRLIEHAKEAGADAVKFQAVSARCLTYDSDHAAYTLKDTVWAGRSLYELYSRAATPRAWWGGLFCHAGNVGIPIFASVASAHALDELEAIGCPIYKVPSAEVADPRFVELVATTGKPVILSDGMATPSQMAAAMRVVPHSRLVILKCVSEYPAPTEGYNLAALTELRELGIACGVSDHTIDRTIPVMAATLGAQMLEKHLMAGDCLQVQPLDFHHSLGPWEFGRMVTVIREAEAAMGKVVVGASADAGKGWRRRLVAARDLPAGHVLGPDDVATARCGEGLEPDEHVIGRTLTVAVSEGDPFTRSAFMVRAA